MKRDKIHMFQGEKRLLSVEVIASDHQPFTIQSAEYEVSWLDEAHNLLVRQDGGICDIDGHTISNMVVAEYMGEYVVKYTLRIANETIIQKVYVTVCDC